MAMLRRGAAAALVALFASACSDPGADDSTQSGGSGGGTSGSPGGGTGGTSGGGTSGGGTSGGGTSGSPGGGTGGSAGVSGSQSGGASGSSGAATGGAGTSGTGGSAGASGDAPRVGSCVVFPVGDPWNRDISGAAVDATWTERIQNLVGNVNIHPDYGVDGTTLYGIPINVVPASQPAVPIAFDWYEDESDPGPYPFPGPDDIAIEGQSPTACDGDCHVLVVQEGDCILYEGYACEYQSDGWHCGNGAKWDLNRGSYGQREIGWTSADAAGLPIMPGLVRYAEVRAGVINHAIRFTVPCTRPNYVNPATHYAVPGSCDIDDPDAPPMGIRVRLQADFDDSSFPASARVVTTAMKRYGLILADNGSSFYFQGDSNAGWTEDDIEPLKDIPASAFEAVDVPPLEP
jgi:hypothetical protein